MLAMQYVIYRHLTHEIQWPTAFQSHWVLISALPIPVSWGWLEWKAYIKHLASQGWGLHTGKNQRKFDSPPTYLSAHCLQCLQTALAPAASNCRNPSLSLWGLFQPHLSTTIISFCRMVHLLAFNCGNTSKHLEMHLRTCLTAREYSLG